MIKSVLFLLFFGMSGCTTVFEASIDQIDKVPKIDLVGVDDLDFLSSDIPYYKEVNSREGEEWYKLKFSMDREIFDKILKSDVPNLHLNFVDCDEGFEIDHHWFIPKLFKQQNVHSHKNLKSFTELIAYLGADDVAAYFNGKSSWNGRLSLNDEREERKTMCIVWEGFSHIGQAYESKPVKIYWVSTTF